MKIRLELMKKDKTGQPIGAILPSGKKPGHALVILDGDRGVVKEVERLIETNDDWDIF